MRIIRRHLIGLGIFILLSINGSLAIAACANVNLQTSYVPHPNGAFRIGVPSENLEQKFSTESNEGQIKIRHFYYESFNEKAVAGIVVNLSIIDKDILDKAKKVSFDTIFSDVMNRGKSKKSKRVLYIKKNLVIDGWDSEEFAFESPVRNGKIYWIVRSIFQKNNLYTVKTISDCMDNSQKIMNSFHITK